MSGTGATFNAQQNVLQAEQLEPNVVGITVLNSGQGIAINVPDIPTEDQNFLFDPATFRKDFNTITNDCLSLIADNGK